MMLRRDDMSPEEWTAICTPINEVLPANERLHTGALFIGSWFASVDTDLLKSYKINELVVVMSSSTMSIPPSEGRGAYTVPIEDSTEVDLRPYLEGVCNHISECLRKGQNVLVHCQQGISRSASFVIAYLMREKGLGYDEAHEFVKMRRFCVKPNSRFESTLRDWEKELARRKLVERT